MPSETLDAPSSTLSVFVEDAATLLGVSRRTVYYRIREGRLRTIRTRCGSQRILLESIDELLRDEARKRAARTARRAIRRLARPPAADTSAGGC
jgi:excisionase family DNA binding protein